MAGGVAVLLIAIVVLVVASIALLLYGMGAVLPSQDAHPRDERRDRAGGDARVLRRG